MANLCEKRLFLLDMDGTLYLDETLFDGSAALLQYIRSTGGRYLFLTNNSSRGIEQYQEKMNRLGIPAGPEDFFTSVDATIMLLRERYGERASTLRIYAAGTASFRKQLTEAGLQVTDRREPGIELLLSGFDTELTFQKLEDACVLLKEGVDWLATNPDWVCPTWYGYVPDCGSVCRMLTQATGRSPEFIGKPEPRMALAAMQKTGFRPEETLMVGDRIYTDIACGVNAGIDTVLVLSGETTAADAAASAIRPTWMLQDVKELLQKIQSNARSENL